MQRLMAYPWPGNVREMVNKIQYAAAVARGPVIEAEDLFTSYDETALKSFRKAKAEAVRSFERQYLTALLRAHNGNIPEAAQTAGVSRTNFYVLLRRHRINPSAFKTGPPAGPSDKP
jgi:two-component system response regulator GlrR